MKTLTVMIAAVLILSCNNAADQGTTGPDTTSSLPAPSTIDTNRLKADTPKVEKALRK